MTLWHYLKCCFFATLTEPFRGSRLRRLTVSTFLCDFQDDIFSHVSLACLYSNLILEQQYVMFLMHVCFSVAGAWYSRCPVQRREASVAAKVPNTSLSASHHQRGPHHNLFSHLFRICEFLRFSSYIQLDRLLLLPLLCFVSNFIRIFVVMF